MPLSPSVPRKHLHQRKYDMNGYIREDGLWDIEAQLTDEKSYGFDSDFRGRIEAGDYIHDMKIRLTIDDGFTIKAIEAVTDASPYRLCPDITPNFERMVGVRIGPGWRKNIRERLGGVHGCTHLVEMLTAMATVAYQTFYSSKAQTGKQPVALNDEPGTRPALLNSCHAYREDGPVVQKNFPDFYTGPKSDG